MREARRVAFGKAVLAEALDLVEAALGEIGVVAARDHAPDHLVLEDLDIPPGTKARHCLAQLVRFLRAEFRRVERDLHRLLLEDRYAERPPEDFFQLIRRSMRRVGTGKGHRV